MNDNVKNCSLWLRPEQQYPAHGDRTPGNAHATAEQRNCLLIRKSIDEHFVLFLQLIAGMGNAVEKFAVIREQQQAGGIAVKTSYWDNPLGNINEVEHRLSAAFVSSRGNIPNRLMEHDVAWASHRQRATIHPNILPFGIDAHTELAHNLAVDRYTTSLN
jgi:hypothetical protein